MRHYGWLFRRTGSDPPPMPTGIMMATDHRHLLAVAVVRWTDSPGTASTIPCLAAQSVLWHAQRVAKRVRGHGTHALSRCNLVRRQGGWKRDACPARLVPYSAP